MYNLKDSEATLRQVWSTQLITCKKCRAIYIEYTGRRIGGKFGEQIPSALSVPETYIMLDITIDMDVESQPGPETDRSLGGVN